MSALTLFCAVALLVAPGQDGRLRVHVDADTGNEVDDLYAIVRALVEPRFEVVGLSSAQYHTQKGAPKESARVSQALNEKLRKLFGRDDLPCPLGSDLPLADASTPRDSAAARFIVEQARATPAGGKLDVLAFGAVTNVASAVLLDPSIVPKLRVGAMLLRYDAAENRWNRREFNADNDQKAVDVLLGTPGLDLRIMTATASRPFVLRKETVEARLRGKGGVWDALVDRWDGYLKTMTWSIAGMDHSKEWVMWDIAIVEATADPSRASSRRVTGPTGREVTVYTSIDADGMRAAFWEAVGRAAK